MSAVGVNHSASPKALARANRKAARPTRGDKGLTPRVKAAIDALIYDGCNLTQASAKARLTDRAFRDALRKPEVLAYYKAEYAAYRDAARAGNVRAVLRIRDNEDLAETAAGANAVINAAHYLDGPRDPAPGVNVNIGVNVNQTAPGYQIDATRFDPEAIARALASAGSDQSILHARLTATDAEHEDIPPTQTHEQQDVAANTGRAHVAGACEAGPLIQHQRADEPKPLSSNDDVGRNE